MSGMNYNLTWFWFVLGFIIGFIFPSLIDTDEEDDFDDIPEEEKKEKHKNNP